MNKNTEVNKDGFLLELYRQDSEEPCYVSAFDPDTEAGFADYSPDKQKAVVFESRDALLPLAAIEVEAVLVDEEDQETSVYNGFKILPASGTGDAQFVTKVELETALELFES